MADALNTGMNMTDPKSAQSIRDALNRRFGETLPVDDNLTGLDELARLAGRRVQRRTAPRAVDPELLRLLCACALSAPSKSDLQQAGIVLATFLRAADAVGLGTCPISVIRDHSARVSEMLRLPQRIIPVAGLTVGWPSEAGHISPRLSLSSTVHDGQYDEGDLAQRIDAYDKRRAAVHPYKPRDPARWGDVKFYGWSEDKARQYGVPQRADFGAFVRKKGFKLD